MVGNAVCLCADQHDDGELFHTPEAFCIIIAGVIGFLLLAILAILALNIMLTRGYRVARTS